MFQIDFIEVIGNCLLFVLVFGMSATVDIDSLQSQLKNRTAIMTGILLQFFVLPFLGFVVVKSLNLPHAMGITLLVVTSSPGGSYSNWWCSLFNADLALSVTMTAISTLLSVIMLPLNLLIYAKLTYKKDVIGSISWVSLFVSLIVVILAIALGLYISAKLNSFRINILANKMGNLAGVALVVFSAVMSNGDGESGLFNRSWKFYIGVAAPCILGLITANLITSMFQLEKPERVTVSIECCYQNVGIATSVALTMFEGNNLSEAIGVPLYYGALEAIILSFYCIGAWKMGWTKAPPSDSLWKTIATSYEVLLIEQKALKEIEVSLAGSESTEKEEVDDNGTIFHYFNMSPGNRGKKEPSGLDIIEIGNSTRSFYIEKEENNYSSPNLQNTENQSESLA